MKHADIIANALRAIAPGGKLTNADVPLINQLGALWDARAPVAQTAPKWVEVARSLIGVKEIVGPKHNPIVVSWWQKGAAWFRDDETPWCGAFVKHCMDTAGFPYPKNFPAAASWAEYGISVPAQLGAIGVKKRTGGNHVFFIVGETADKRFFKALGGNQGNAVSIMDIAKSDVYSIRWPAGAPQTQIPLPTMPAGIISRNEA